MSYEKFYPNGWQSGETGGTPITPEALNHIENGIKQTYNEFAPAGYGLGGSGNEVTDLNEALGSGFFVWGSGCANAPFAYGMGITVNRHNGRYTQILIDPGMEYGFAQIAFRHYTNNTWVLEWLTPPLNLGVEYRTVERCEGKPVYITRIKVGDMGDGGVISATLPGTPKKIVDLSGVANKDNVSEQFPIIRTNGAIGAIMRKTGSMSIVVAAFEDFTGYEAIATIKYTKD